MMKNALAAVALLLLASLSPGPFVGAAAAQGLRVISDGPSQSLQVQVSRAIVIEAPRPFAEVSIANPEIADISTLSDNAIYLLGRAPGRTTLTLLDADGGLIANVQVAVEADLSEFKERLRQILPGERIEVRAAASGIVLSGIVSSIAALDRALELAELYAPEQVSNLMVVGGTQQVNLTVRFAEMERSVRKELNGGFGLTGDGDVEALSGTAGTIDPEAGAPIGEIGSLGFEITPGSAGELAAVVGSSSLALSVLIDTLEARGFVRTLAEPNLTALSGQEARFLAGGEFPVPVAQEDGVITIEFKPFGIELLFVPRVVDGDVVNLELLAAVSAIDSASGITAAGLDVAAFSRRETKTTVEMRDGESFAIAGLISDEFEDSATKVPFLGDIPVLGALFRSVSFSRDQSELVVIITAHLVSPIKGDALLLPTDTMRLPTERDLFVFGRTEGEEPGVGEVARQDFQGSYGYVME